MIKRIARKEVYDGKIIKVFVDDILDERLRPTVRELVVHVGGVCVLACVDDEIYFVKQHRYPFDDYLLELPAGKKEVGEEPLVTAIRELEEEIGYHPHKMEFYGEFIPTCAYDSEVIHLYVASDLEFVGQNLDEGEYIEVIKIHKDKVKAMLKNNEFTDGKTAYLLTAYFWRNNE
ncbi:MAG: NUDIX hydrolase [Erysipelotrichaceae bacterium]